MLVRVWWLCFRELHLLMLVRSSMFSDYRIVHRFFSFLFVQDILRFQVWSYGHWLTICSELIFQIAFCSLFCQSQSFVLFSIIKRHFLNTFLLTIFLALFYSFFPCILLSFLSYLKLEKGENFCGFHIISFGSHVSL